MMHLLSKNIVFFSLIFLLAGFVSAGDKLVDGDWYSIKGDNDTWLSYDKESKSFILKSAAFKSRLKAIKKEDNQFIFQLEAGEYLSASNDGTVTIRENPWGWEMFKIQDAPGQKYYLRSTHSNYLRTNYQTYRLDLSPYLGVWEAIEFIKEAPPLSAGDKLVDGNWYSIKGDNDTWLSYDKESKSFILKSEAFKSRFKAIKKENNQFIFQLAAGEYLSASNDGTVTIRENPWDWETFTIQDAPNQKYYLRSIHGNYLRTNYQTYKLDLSQHLGDWEAIEFRDSPRSYNDVPGIWERLHATVFREKGITGKDIRVGIIDDGINCNAPEIKGKCIFVPSNSINAYIKISEIFDEDEDMNRPVDPHLVVREKKADYLYSGGNHGPGMALILAGSKNSSGQVGFASGAELIPYQAGMEPLIFKAAYENHQVRIMMSCYGQKESFPELVDDWTRLAPVRYQEQWLEGDFEPEGRIGRYLAKIENKTDAEIRAIRAETKKKFLGVVNNPALRHRTPELIRVFCARNKGSGHDDAPDTTPFSKDAPASGYPDDGNILIVGAVDEHNRLTSESLKPGNTRKFYVVVPSGGPTSPAGPTVAGILASLMEADTKLFGNHGRPSRQYVDAVVETATPLADADSSGTGPETGRGLVKVQAALNWLERHPYR